MEYPAHTGYHFTKTIHNDIYPATDPTKSDLSQPGKVVLITGAGRGLGQSMALRYAEAGVAGLVLCARTPSQLDATEQAIKKLNPSVRVTKIAGDVTYENSMIAMAAAVKKEYGRLDVLINNAGTTNRWDEPIHVGDSDEWLRCWDLHIKGTFLTLKACLPLLVETAQTHKVHVNVINLTTIAAYFAFPGASGYMASKFALIRLAEFVQSEYEAQGVDCVSLHPGSVDTGIAKDLGPEIQAAMIDKAELVAGSTVWLTKTHRAWLNGRYVSATWDVTELEAMKDEIVQGDKLKVRMVV